MLYKLFKLGIGGNFYQVIKSMYSSVNASVRCKDFLSENIQVFRGVKQGDILSPIIFNIFINDIICGFNDDICCPPKLVKQDVGSLLYADDLVILSTTENGLQMGIDKLHAYCEKWKLSINSSKSNTMCLTNQHKGFKTSHHIYGTKIEQEDRYNYLGL